MADERLWMTEGDLDLYDHIMEQVAEVGAPADVDVMATAAGVRDCRRLAAARDEGLIGTLRVILDAGTLRIRSRAKDGQRSNAQNMEDALGRDAVRCIRVHAKAARIAGPEGEVAFVTSANLNNNNRPEQYEATPELGPTLDEMFTAVFERVPPGCANPSGRDAYQGLSEALDELEGPGLIVYRPSRAMPAHEIAAFDADQILIVERAGVGELLEGLIELAGTCTVRGSTWKLGRGDVHVLSAGLVDGRVTKVDLALPSRFGRRGSNADGYHAAMGLLAGSIRWSPSHAKVLVVRGEDETFVVTGGANFANQGQLDIIRVRRGDEAMADLADGLLDELPIEDAPPPPSTMQIQTARATFEKKTRRAAPGSNAAELAPEDRARLEQVCRVMNLDPDNLPPGLEPIDLLEGADEAPADERARGPGRPRKSDPAIPWTEIHDLLVYGEDYLDEGGERRRRYLSPTEIARKYGCAKSTVQAYIKKHDIERRRADVKAEEDAIVRQHVVHERAAERASLADKVDQIAHVLADRYLEGLLAPRKAPNHIRVDSINDVRQGVELAKKLSESVGNPDGQVSVTLTIDGIRDRHDRVRRRQKVVAGVALGAIADDSDGEGLILDVTPRHDDEPIPVEATHEQLADGRPVDPQVTHRLGIAVEVDPEPAVDPEDDDPWSEDP